MHELGHLALMASLVTATLAGVASVVGHRRAIPSLERAGLSLVVLLAALVTLSASCMLYLLVVGDFSVKFVERHTDSTMPLVYVISAFWGGQEGSLLFWLWVLSLYGAAALWINRRHTRLVPYASAVIMTTVAFFALVLLFAANPFEVSLGEPAVDGRGLNPMLQNPYMATHPPTIYLGYIGMTIPFAFGIAAMISGQTDETWLGISRRWTLAGWLFLSLGLILGKLWAYEELAWGGYWSWDPVENAGLLPWLTCTAFLHSVMIQERRGMFKRWNMTLVILSFAFTIVGTFITRSGIVHSVHSFAQSEIGHFFLVYLLFVLSFSFSLMWLKSDSLTSRSDLESVLSREFAFGLNNWILLGMAFFLLLATLFPAISEHVTGQTISVGQPFFNDWMIPLGLTLLLLTGVGPLIAWRRASADSLLRQFAWPAVAMAVAFLLSSLLGSLGRGPYPAITHGLSAFVLSTIVQEVVRGMRARASVLGEEPLVALGRLVTRGRRRYGGYLVHLGIVLMFIGWSGNAFQHEKEVSLAPFETAAIGRYQVRYEGMDLVDSPHRRDARARVLVTSLEGEELATLEPARWLFKKSSQPTTKVAIRTTIREDLYLILASFDPETEQVALRILINPLVLWIWVGSLLLLVGTVVAMWPERKLERAA